MHHADASLVPSSIQDKRGFWKHIHKQLENLTADQRNWVTNLANASSLIFQSLLDFPAHFGSGSGAVNWCGFYIDASLFSMPRLTPKDSKGALATNRLLLSPFCGLPACQYIDVSPGKQRPGVCASAYLARRTVLVTNVHQHPGHIACDGRTKSEIVCPLLLERGDGDVFVVGVLDLDCLAFGGFDLDDQEGLENIAKLLVEACDW